MTDDNSPIIINHRLRFLLFQTSSTPTPKPVNNCKEMLGGRVQVTWELMGEDVQIRISGRIREDQYVAFGLSGKDGQAEMIGGDVVVIGYDNRTGKFIAEDYYMSDIAQCDGKRGVCPDERIGGRNDVMFVHGERKNGITTGTCLSYKLYNLLAIETERILLRLIARLFPSIFYFLYDSILISRTRDIRVNIT